MVTGARRAWLPVFAMVTVASALPVLLSGGLVTSTGTGLAVPDWPTSYNANMFLYPLSKMTGGIYYEHAHRLFGSLVGLTTLTLAVFTLIADRRTLQRVLAVGALVFVGFQGVLGGVRVTSATVVSDELSEATLADNKGSLALAAFHGVSAQVFIAFLCVVACVLSERWRRSETEGAARADSGLRSGALLALLAIIGQLVLGSVSRHFQQPHAAYTHAVFGLVVLSLCSVAGFRAAGRHRDEPVLRMLGPAVSHTSILQFLLGVATFLAVLPYEKGKVDPAYAVVIATAHQGLGAVLLGSTAMLVLWSRRLLNAGPVTEASATEPSATEPGAAGSGAGPGRSSELRG
jgi:cytochrome c oxidase assembly protein subunit 15